MEISLPSESKEEINPCLLFSDGKIAELQFGDCSFIFKFTPVNSGLWTSSFF